MDVRTKEEIDVLNAKLDVVNSRLWWLMKEINPKKVEKLEKEEEKEQQQS